jgi:hypothetical protein
VSSYEWVYAIQIWAMDKAVAIGVVMVIVLLAINIIMSYLGWDKGEQHSEMFLDGKKKNSNNDQSQ